MVRTEGCHFRRRMTDSAGPGRRCLVLQPCSPRPPPRQVSRGGSPAPARRGSLVNTRQFQTVAVEFYGTHFPHFVAVHLFSLWSDRISLCTCVLRCLALRPSLLSPFVGSSAPLLVASLPPRERSSGIRGVGAQSRVTAHQKRGDAGMVCFRSGNGSGVPALGC